MAMFGWVGAGMEVMVGKYADKARIGWPHVSRCRSTSQERGEETDETQSHHLSGAQLRVGSGRKWSVIR